MKTQSDCFNDVSKLKDFVEGRIVATPVSFDRTEVVIDLDAQILSEYKRELFASWNQAVAIMGIDLDFTEGDLSKYIDMLVVLRVDYVNGKRVSVKPTDGVVVPSFLSLILSNVGLARNPDLGIEVYPVVLQAETTPIDADFLWAMSRKIRVLSHAGIEYADGYTRSRDGSYEFMSMTLIEAYVRNATNTVHPVYALMAGTLGVRGIETVLSPRINYGSENHLRSLVRHLAATKR